jgi:hypothetical protein
LAAAEAALDLPFAVRPGLLAATLPDVGALKASLPLASERIATRGGALVLERRRTAWVAEAGVGALAYSGKLMAPKPLPEPVAVARDALADALYGDALRHDCALLNLYAKGEKAACKYHSDPEHGTYWHRENQGRKESEIPNLKGSDLGRFPLVSADFWTSDRLSERSRSVGAFSGTRARGTLTLKRR